MSPHGGIDANSANLYGVEALASYDFGWSRLSSTTSFRQQQTQTLNGANIDLQTAAMLEARRPRRGEGRNPHGGEGQEPLSARPVPKAGGAAADRLLRGPAPHVADADGKRL